MFNEFNVEVTTNKLMTKARGRLIDVFENNDADYIAVASTLDINIQHVQQWVCLFNWLLRVETHLGPNGTRL